MKVKGTELVSIIIPVYNVKTYLKEALDSIVNQTYRNIEIILIDDGSTDGSGEICDEYAQRDERIIIIHQANQGLSVARNVGLDLMKGEYVAFLDSDDAFHSQMIEMMTKAIKREKTDYAICAYIVHYTDAKKAIRGVKTISICEGVYDRNTILRYLVDGELNIVVWNKLFKACLWNNIRFPVGRVFEDSALLQILFRASNAYVLSDVLYLHRKRPGSITTTNSIRRYRDYIMAHQEYEAFVRQYTPEIFSERDNIKLLQGRITGMISFYVKLLCQPNDVAELKDIRSQIICLAKTTKMNSIRARCAYWMILICPMAIKVIYPVYLSLTKQLQVV